MSANGAAAAAYLEEIIQNPAQRSDAIAYHRQRRRIGGFDYRPDEAELGRLVGKYWRGLEGLLLP